MVVRVIVMVFCLSPGIFCLYDPIFHIQANGYPGEKHIVKTEDGYLTVLHRIPHGKNKKNIGDPIMLTHGLGACSGIFMVTGPKIGLGYILADAGYDVWLSNSRGNTFSREVTPTSVDTSSKTFNNYSVHEIGIYDYPAQIDYILNKTKKTQIFYASHSQGGTAFYIMTSKRPEYNKKIRLASLLAPSSIMNHTAYTLKFVSKVIFEIEDMVNRLQIYDTPITDLFRNLFPIYCMLPFSEFLCRLMYNMFLGYDDYKQLNLSTISIFHQIQPSDSSLKCLYHYGQIIKSGVFQEYDYRREGNLKQYGTEKPPRYNFSAITAPIAIYYGLNDQYINKKDIDAVVELLPNVVHKYCVPWPKWNHGDFLTANDVVPLLYNELIRIMKLY